MVISNPDIIRKRSVNISGSGSNIDLYNSKNLKNNEVLLNKRKRIKIDDERILQKSLLERLKESPMFQKSEKILNKQKLIDGFLGFFSFMSIILQIVDVILYNSKSNEYLEKMNNKKLWYLSDFTPFVGFSEGGIKI